jgi:hypothetical protein
MGEKQKTLRPEIQLLNTLLACKSQSERQKVSLHSQGCARVDNSAVWALHHVAPCCKASKGHLPEGPNTIEWHAFMQVYIALDTVERLTMNDRYFFRMLLDRMIQGNLLGFHVCMQRPDQRCHHQYTALGVALAI